MFLFLFLLNLTTLLTLLKKLPSVLILESLWFSTKALQLGKTADWQAPTLSPWTSPSAGPVILNLESVHQIEPGSFHPRLIKSSRPTPQESKVFFYIHKYKKSYWVTTLKSNSHVNIQSCYLFGYGCGPPPSSSLLECYKTAGLSMQRGCYTGRSTDLLISQTSHTSVCSPRPQTQSLPKAGIQYVSVDEMDAEWVQSLLSHP